MWIPTMAAAVNRSSSHNINQTLRIFAGVNGSVLTHKQLFTIVNSGWSQPSNAGYTGIVKQFATGSDVSGRINVFALTAAGECYQILETAAKSGVFVSTDMGVAGWQEMALACNCFGRFELFGLAGGAIHHVWQTDSDGHWSKCVPIANTSDVQQVVVATNASGGIDVCALGGDGRVWNFAKTGSVMNSNWSGSELLKTPGLQQIVLVQNADKTLALYGLAGSGVWLTTKTPRGWDNVKQLAIDIALCAGGGE